jgi:hypothetical protein
MKQGVRVISLIPGFEKALDAVFAEINIRLSGFEKQYLREPTKAEAEAITKDVMNEMFPGLEKTMKILGRGVQVSKFKDLIFTWIKTGMKPNQQQQ